ncbi:unnamed protein product [Soboliphyme baturini]|uniref:S1 motif domain-containing protein n=1 Tax=Soboliphyme baturini TaxID=241478 RepID=A0A183J2S8_9BILA|nr:unnamed protein product [Soboliphyme baturini]
MTECMPQPRTQLKVSGPAEEKFIVPASKRSRFIGPGGYNLRKIQSETGAQVSQIDECTYSLFATNQSCMKEAKEMIEHFLEENVEDKLEFGGIYTATIVELRNNGVMVTLHPAMTPVLLPNSQLDMRRIDHPSILNLKVGQEISVKYFGRDPSTGSIRLSRKVLQKIGTDSAKQPLPQALSSPWFNKSVQ